MWLRLAKEDLDNGFKPQDLGWLYSGMGVISLKTSLSPCLLDLASFNVYQTQIPGSSKSHVASAKPWPAHLKPRGA